MVEPHAVYPTGQMSWAIARLLPHALIFLVGTLCLLLICRGVSAADGVDVADDVEPSSFPLELSGSLDLVYDGIKNVALGQRPGDDLLNLKQELQLQLFYSASERLSAFSEIKWRADQQIYPDEIPQWSEEVRLGESWLHWQPLSDSAVSIKIGRQYFVEPRQWWWYDVLDALRFDYTRDPWHLTIGVAETLVRTSSRENFINPQEEDVLRLLGHVDWKLSTALQFSAFYLGQRDHSTRPPLDSLMEIARVDESDADLHWIGLRVSGDIDLTLGSTLKYWADAAAVSGDETLFEFTNEVDGISRVTAVWQQRVRGDAVDLGLVWESNTARRPTLAVSYARGSGDTNLDDDTDRAFRQTGLQYPFQEFRYYGELLRPELSNLSITTVTMGFAVTTGSYLTLGYHRFRQVYPTDFLRYARIELLPTGQDNDIGSELSLLIEIREWENLAVVLAAATFQAGDAFGAAAGVRAESLFLKLTLWF